jgi:hypothetical protein
VKIFEDTEKYYALLLDRVGKMVKDGKSLDDIKKELKMPEYEHWATKERFPTNVEAAYKAVKGNLSDKMCRKLEIAEKLSRTEICND